MTFLGDLLGSTIALVSDAGTVDTQYSYEPFGASLASGAASSNPYQFAFHQNDGTGLYYYSARYYSSTLGRFISEDPSGASGGINLYAYASDNPVTLEDQDGLSPSSGSGSCKPCDAKLRYRGVDSLYLKFLKISHSFWDVDDGNGTRKSVSGVPVGGYVNEATNYPTDGPGGAIWFDSGSSPTNCSGVDNLLRAANNWPQNQIPYDYLFGPNSNSAARYFGDVAGFYPTTPPGAWGWWYPVLGVGPWKSFKN
jgi:RHS repeat-associated protein